MTIYLGIFGIFYLQAVVVYYKGYNDAVKDMQRVKQKCR
jgi:hypothetical protein